MLDPQSLASAKGWLENSASWLRSGLSDAWFAVRNVGSVGKAYGKAHKAGISGLPGNEVRPTTRLPLGLPGTEGKFGLPIPVHGPATFHPTSTYWQHAVNKGTKGNSARFNRGLMFAGGALLGGSVISGMAGGPGVGDALKAGAVIGGIAGARYGIARYGAKGVGMAAGITALGASAYAGARLGEEQFGINPLLAAGAVAGTMYSGYRGAKSALNSGLRIPNALKPIQAIGGFAHGAIAGPMKGILKGSRAIGSAAGIKRGWVRGTGENMSVLQTPGVRQTLGGMGIAAGGMATLNYMNTGDVRGSMRNAPAFTKGINASTFGLGPSQHMRPRPPQSIAHLYGTPY